MLPAVLRLLVCASTLYYVRVLARNVEGSSGWSPTASFTTRSVSPTPVSNVPVSGSSATQSVVVTVVDVVEAPSNVTSVVGLSQDFGNLSSAG